MTETVNINNPRWERESNQGPFAIKGYGVARAAGSQQVGATLYEIAPGKKNMPFHAHLATEELLIVLQGTPTLRTDEGERLLAEGEVVAFPAGKHSAHQLINRTDKPTRHLMISNKVGTDVAIYPDSNKIAARSGEYGDANSLSFIAKQDSAVEYFQGELD